MEVLLLDTLYKVIEEEKEGFIKEEVSCIMYIRKLLSNDNEGRELHGYSDSGRTYRRCGYWHW